MPGKTPLSQEQANRIAECLAEETPADGLLSMDVEFGYWHDMEREMQSEQGLLAHSLGSFKFAVWYRICW